MSRNDALLPADDTRPFRIDVVLVDGFALLSHAAAIEPFRAANILSGRTLYSWRHLSPGDGEARASNGLRLVPDDASDTQQGPPDLVMVVAGGDPAQTHAPALPALLRRADRGGAVLCGVSAGPWLLAAAGLLDGYRATIHWEHQATFVETFPRVTLESSLFVADRTRVTCAGGTAALDMAVELIARAHGRPLAARVADWFISTHARPAHDAQRFGIGARYGVASPPLLRALALMEASVEEPAPRAAIAAAAGVSLRQLERLFARHLKVSIRGTFANIRLDHAAHLARTTAMPFTEIAAATGFASAAHFSRAFRARHGVPPRALRRDYLAGKATGSAR